jgi:hypothetical protein
MKEENYIDQEVRIRLLESTTKEIKDAIYRLDNKLDSHFKWTLATILTLFGGIILHMAKLV